MVSQVPNHLLYTETHEWVKVDGDVATVGISDFAQNQLTDIVFVEMPVIGRTVVQGKECAIVESTKAASDIYAPVSGVIQEVNSILESHPERINQDPYGEGWLCKIQMTHPGELEGLLTPDRYQQVTVAG